MKLFGRELSGTQGEVKEIYKYVWYFLKCFFVFRNPFSIIYHYLAMTSPKSGVIRLRNGWKVHLSGHPHDVITVFVVFIRRDYGMVPSGSVVIDIGANIGIFSLYAAMLGARAVHAIEPNSENFLQLSRNIRENHLENVVRAHRMAVAGVDADRVKFPKFAGMYNAIIRDDSVQEYEYVHSLTLEKTIARILPAGHPIDLVKMDCEGEEYAILLSARSDDLAKFGEIRLEYHRGGVTELLSFLERHGYVKRRLKEESRFSGILWVERVAGKG